MDSKACFSPTRFMFGLWTLLTLMLFPSEFHTSELKPSTETKPRNETAFYMLALQNTPEEVSSSFLRDALLIRFLSLPSLFHSIVAVRCRRSWGSKKAQKCLKKMRPKRNFVRCIAFVRALFNPPKSTCEFRLFLGFAFAMICIQSFFTTEDRAPKRRLRTPQLRLHPRRSQETRKWFSINHLNRKRINR